MAKPAWKTTNMKKALDDMSEMVYGRPASVCIQFDVCVKCGKRAVDFTDELSRREFSISGLCQECQDFIFNPDKEE